MKRFLLTSGQKVMMTLVALLLIFGTFQPLLAQAQGAPLNILANSPVANQTTTNTSAGATTATAAVPTTQTYGGVTNSDIGCNLATAWNSGAGSTLGICLSNVVYVFTVGIGSGFAYVAAYFFDWAVSLSLNSLAYSLNFISTGWTTARDLANMAFLFILIYIALKIMFEAETGHTVQMLAAVIVVALIVNFSFFFTRVVIDAGNIVAIQFYNAINAPPVGQSNAAAAGAVTTVAGAVSSSGTSSFSNSKDLTASIMGMLQLQNLFNTTSFNAFLSQPQSNGTTSSPGFLVTFIALSFLYIAAGIMFWILTVMFATAGVKFLFRIVALWFLIIASPLALIAGAVEGFNKGYFSQWRGLLIANTFYPVAFMFVFLILVNFSNQMAGSGLINGIFDGLSGSVANSSSAVAAIGYAAANVGIRMGFVVAMLYVGLMVAQKMETLGNDAANKFGDRVGGWFKGATLGLAARTGGFAFRETIGRQAQKDADALKKNPPRTAFGQYIDYRYRKNVLEPIAGAKVGGATSYTDVYKARKERRGEVAGNVRNADNLAQITQAPETAKNLNALQSKARAAAAGGPALTVKEQADRTRLETEMRDIQKRIGGLSDNEMNSMKVDDLKKIAFMLSEDQIKRIGKLDKFTDKEKADIADERTKAINDATSKKLGGALTTVAKNAATPGTIRTAGVPDIEKKAAQSLTTQELKVMQPEDLKNIAALLTEDQKKKLMDIEDIPQQIREDIQNTWTEHADDSPLQKALSKLSDAVGTNATAMAAIAAAKTTPGTILNKSWFETNIKSALQTDLHNATASWNTTRNATNHATMQLAQEKLEAYKEFENNRKNIESHAEINSNGTKGTLKAGLLR